MNNSLFHKTNVEGKPKASYKCGKMSVLELPSRTAMTITQGYNVYVTRCEIESLNTTVIKCNT